MGVKKMGRREGEERKGGKEATQLFCRLWFPLQICDPYLFRAQILSLGDFQSIQHLNIP